jgi:two-component system OmpR family response regulator
MREHILVVEDEQHLGVGIKYNLEAEGYRVTLVDDGPTALKLITADPASYRLIVLDLMLPGMSGYEICQKIRAAGNHVPVLILSARSLSEDRTRGFDCGANQYLTKPFDLDELISRAGNLIRSGTTRENQPALPSSEQVHQLSFGDAFVNFETYEVKVGGKPRKLTAKELTLLKYFAQNKNRVISRNELLTEVWGMAAETQTRSVDQYMSRLRKTFEPDPTHPVHFLTYRDAGYQFITDPN